MGRQWNAIIDALSGGTMSINANLTDIEALLTTLQADVADGITVSGTVTSDIGTAPFSNVNNDTSSAGQSVKVGWTDSGSGDFYQTSDVNPFPTQIKNLAEIIGGGYASLFEIADNGALSVNVPNAVITRPGGNETGGTGPTTFTSTSYGTIAISNANRKGLTVFSEGPGNLHITLGTATTSTSSYTVRLSSGDYYEVPFNYTGLVGGIFATAGTARVTQIT